MDIGNLKNNSKYYDKFIGEDSVTFRIVEQPEYNIEVWLGYIASLYFDIELYDWKGMTKDYEESSGPWDSSDFVKIDLDEYYEDIKSYKDKKYYFEETNEIISLLLVLFEYARKNNLHIEISVY